MTISHLRLERKKEEMAKKVETVIDDLARLKLVRQIVDEQIQLRQNILRERLSKNLKIRKHIFLGQDWSILAIFKDYKRLDSEKLRKAIGERKYDSFKTKKVRSVEFKPVANQIEHESDLTKELVNSTVLNLVKQKVA